MNNRKTLIAEMRYYLDQRIKFWLAFMGLLTLIYVGLFGDQNTRKKSLLLTRAEFAVLVSIAKQDDDGQKLWYYTVSNAKEYANSLGFDYVELQDDWQNELLSYIATYPKGILLLQASPLLLNTESAISLPLNKNLFTHSELADASAAKSLTAKPAALILSSEDESLLSLSCFENNVADGSGSKASAVHACSKAKKKNVLYFDKSNGEVTVS